MADLDDRRALIAKLFGAAGKVPSESVYEGYLETLKRMDTAKLFRMVERVLEGISELTDPDDYKPPSAGALWKVSRAMRALPPPLELKASEPKWLPFNTNANQLLLQYFWDKRAAGVMERYAPDCELDQAARLKPPGPLARARTAVMVKWKNEWAAEMRETHERGEKLDGKALWLDYMTRAEAELDQLIATERVAA